MDGTNPDNDWELKYPIYENDCYYEMLRFAYRKQVSGELELCMESLAEQEFYLTSERIITILKTKGEKRRRRQ